MEYEYTTEKSVMGRADFGNPVLQLGQLVPGTYALEARLYLATRNTRDVLGTGAVVFNPWEDDPAGFPLT